MQSLSKQPSDPLNRFLIGIDSWPWSAVYRVAIGLGIPPVFRALSGDSDSVWIFLAGFAGLLVALRVIPLALRRVLPFSAEARQAWTVRRLLARHQDSYQWQKLFWIGLGLLPHVVLDGGARRGELLVTIFCLIAGALGLVSWQRTKASIGPGLR
jgi:hypothetical protein